MRERYARHLIGKTRRLPSLPVGDMLVIAPHHDDEVLGAGLAMRRAYRRDHRVAVRYMVSDTSPRGSGQRYRESVRALDVLRSFGDEYRSGIEVALADARIPQSLNAWVSCIGRALLDTRPDVILIPHALESHPEHLAVRRAALSLLSGYLPAIAGNVEVYGYAVWAWHAWPFVSVRTQNDWALRRASILASWRTRGGRRLIESFTHRVAGGYDAKKDALACFRSQHVSTPGHAGLGDLGLLDWRWIEGFTRESV